MSRERVGGREGSVLHLGDNQRESTVASGLHCLPVSSDWMSRHHLHAPALPLLDFRRPIAPFV